MANSKEMHLESSTKRKAMQNNLVPSHFSLTQQKNIKYQVNLGTLLTNNGILETGVYLKAIDVNFISF